MKNNYESPSEVDMQYDEVKNMNLSEIELRLNDPNIREPKLKHYITTRFREIITNKKHIDYKKQYYKKSYDNHTLLIENLSLEAEIEELEIQHAKEKQELENDKAMLLDMIETQKKLLLQFEK